MKLEMRPVETRTLRRVGGRPCQAHLRRTAGGETCATEEKYSLESVDRMVAVLDALETATTSLSNKLHAPPASRRSTALRYLLSLGKHDFVERSATNGNFRLGLRLFRLGTLAVDRRDVVTWRAPLWMIC